MAKRPRRHRTPPGPAPTRAVRLRRSLDCGVHFLAFLGPVARRLGDRSAPGPRHRAAGSPLRRPRAGNGAPDGGAASRARGLAARSFCSRAPAVWVRRASRSSWPRRPNGKGCSFSGGRCLEEARGTAVLAVAATDPRLSAQRAAMPHRRRRSAPGCDIAGIVPELAEQFPVPDSRGATQATPHSRASASSMPSSTSGAARRSACRSC